MRGYTLIELVIVIANFGAACCNWLGQHAEAVFLDIDLYEPPKSYSQTS